MPPAPSTDLLKAILAAFNAHDVDGIMGFFAEDCVLDMPRGSEPWGARHKGFGPVRQGLQSRFTGILDVTYGDDTHYVAGDTGMSKWTLRGTIAATGERIEVHGCDFYDFRDGKVVKKDSYWKLVEPAGGG
jgi:ketosteroid isomerase-like protein